MLFLAASLAWFPARAADPEVPVFWDAKERLPKPDLSTLERLRFLTTTDFPPFNFLDRNGRLSGLHVDLSRAICAELDIAAKCQIQALPWGELEQALLKQEGEAIIAGVAVTQETRGKYAFSRPYLQFPARFLTTRNSPLREPIFKAVEDERVGVMAGSAHESMLRDYFPTARVVTYSRQEWLLDDLKQGKIAAAFGDGMRFGFWLAGAESEGCCRFAGGPYLAPEYLGTGLAIAVAPDNQLLVDAFNYALHEISVKGRFAELYLRYFPVGFY
ncbi:MAG: transporter substrate-binding domain-containing protein [Pseudaminobacter sp.]